MFPHGGPPPKWNAFRSGLGYTVEERPGNRTSNPNAFATAYSQQSCRGLVNSAPRQEPASDWSLINRMVAKDETALATLYDRYAGLVCATLNRILRDASATEEILQDIFFQIWRTASSFDPSRGSLPGWLIVAARNRAISKLRKNNPVTREVVESDVVIGATLDTDIARKQMMQKVQGALGGLPAEQRKAVELAYFEGLTHSEIAERTGDPLGTVKTRLRSAVESLKKKLQA